MVKNIMIGFVTGSMLLTGWGVNADSSKEANAVNIANAWLALIDGENYEQSWQEASSLFKGAVTQDQWKTSLKAAREPLGKVVSRQMKSAGHETTLPGAPDGEYVVIQFETSFENKAAAIETVTPMMDKDGVWRISGYFIK
jgi:Protein of unknown function (DUF4019)